jgi:chitin disaccharide deacetylase
MPSSPILQKLGYSQDTRLVITHADDIGMCQASIQAYEDLFTFGTLKSGAVMVPCPWFPAAAAMQKRNPVYDLGVHLVLTSEWELYRWRPLTAGITGSSLLDEEGFFPRSDPEVQERADPDEAGAELLAQVRRAQQFGIDVTHIDTHMGAVAHPKFIPAYIRLAKQFALPPLIPKGDAQMYMSFGMDEETAQYLVRLTASLEDQGIVLVDFAAGLPLDDPKDQLEVAKKMFADLQPGLTHFILHPSVNTPELRAITPDWECRVANYNLFMSDAFKKVLEAEDIKLTGYREVREAMRQ